MKKLLSLVALMILVFAMAGCQKETKTLSVYFVPSRDAAEILEMLAAIATVQYRHGSPFHDEDEFKMNLAQRFLRFKPSKLIRFQYSSRKKLGTLLWNKLGKACVQIWKSCDERELERRKKDNQEKEPFKVKD